MFHTKIKLKYFLNTFHFKIQILKTLMDHIRRSCQSAVGPMSTRPFHSSPLSTVDRVRHLRPKLIHNEEITNLEKYQNQESVILTHSVALSIYSSMR